MGPPTEEESSRRAEVIAQIHRAVSLGDRIRLEDASAFSGKVGEFAYQFEGEDDLLHLAVTRLNSGLLSAEDGQAVASFLLPGMPAGLLWIRPGEHSQHFYCGHDDLVAHVTR